MKQGFADSATQQALLQAAIESLSGTAADKLALIEGAVTSQTASLETKLGLIETAVKEGLADAKAGQALLQQAIESLGSTTAERLLAIEAAMQSGTMSLESKLDVIDAALENGLTDAQEALSLIQQALEALDDTVADKLGAIEEAVKSQATGLASKLALIEAAVAEGFADSAEKQELLRQAVESLGGTMESKLAAITAAINSQASTLSAKLALIETAITTGLADEQAGQKLIEEAIGTLDGTLKEKLAAIKQAIDDQTTSLSSKIDLIDQAVQDSLASSQAAQALLQQAFAALDSTTSARLDTLNAVMNRQTTALWAKLELIELAVRDSLLNTQGAIGQIETAIASLSTALGSTDPNTASVLNGLDSLKTRLDADLAGALSEIFNKIDGLTDYSDILTAIQQALVEILPKEINGHAYVEMGPGIRWATCNVGATKPEEFGDYFAWGEVEPYYLDGYSQENPCTHWKDGKSDGYYDQSNRYYDAKSDSYTKYNMGNETLESMDDAASQNWHGSWRMPTLSEWEWLINHCSFEWTDNYNGTGVSGVIAISTVEDYEGNQIFLPSAGDREGKAIFFDASSSTCCSRYWSSSSSSYSSYSFRAESISLNTYSHEFQTWSTSRFMGFPVRAVSID